MEKGRWIFLRSKLPTEVAPPAMSIHYAIPWPMENTFMDKTFGSKVKKLRKLLKRCAYIDEEELDNTKDENLWRFLSNLDVYSFVEDNDDSLLEPLSESSGFGRPNDYRRLKGAMQIKFAGENIRVFPEEFSIESVDDFPAPLGWYECPMEYGLVFFSEEDMKPRYKETA